VRALRVVWAALLLLIGSGASAQAAPSPALQAQAEALVGYLNGDIAPEALFAPAFLAAVPPATLQGVTVQLRADLGRALKVAAVTAEGPTSGTVSIAHARGTSKFRMVVAAGTPPLIQGLLVTGTERSGDSMAAVVTEFEALPGAVSFAAARLGDGEPVLVAQHRADQPLAIGSAFKLVILAELARATAAGERRWTDVVKLHRQSLPSGVLQAWPKGSPLTLHSLAALMISQSDNSATDTLLDRLGRERVERMMPVLGIKSAERNRPFLSTLEAFALKGGSADAAKWAGANEAQRRAMLARMQPIDASRIDIARLTGAPNRIDEVEWFASPADLVRTVDWLRRSGRTEALDILAINPGIGAAAAGQFDYLGFKGGSEPGVINLTFLLRTTAGRWHAVSGTWNNKAAPVDEAKFVALMSRAVALLK